jgi:hypothetical protein
MGQHGRQHIAVNYGMSSMARRWIELFEELLKRKGITVSDTGGAAPAPEPARVAGPHV